MIIIRNNGDRDLAVERIHRARRLADVLEHDRSRQNLSEAQIAEVRGRIGRHRAAADELERAVATFDALIDAP